MSRPHVLWFDESYDEPRYHFDTVRRLGDQTALLVAQPANELNIAMDVIEESHFRFGLCAVRCVDLRVR